MSLEDILENVTKEGSQMRPVELGKIKIGGKSAEVRKTASGTEWRAPKKWDHFQITTMNRDARGDLIEDKELMAQLLAKYGDPDGKLRRIPIRVLSDDIDDILQSSFVWYGGKCVGARSDGQRVTWFNSTVHATWGKPINPPLVEDWKREFLDLKTPKGQSIFKVHTNFNCVIAAKEAKWGGVYRLRTTSVISLKQLHTSLLHLSQLTGGILTGMPLMLVVRPMQVAPEGNPSTIYVVHVELHGPDLMELQKQAMAFGDFRLKFAERIGQTTRQYRKLLASPGTESADEAKEIQEEFSPDEPPLETVTENSEYGLLEGDQSTTPDDAPTPQDAGDEQPVPPDILPDSEVQQNANHAEPESSGESAESAEMPVEEQLIALMKEVNDDGGFFSVCHRAAMAGKYDKTLEEVSAAVTVYCKLRMSKPGPPHKLTMDGKRRLVRQLISGVFVFPTIPPSQPRPAVGTATGQ